MGFSDSPGQHAVAQEGMQPVFAQSTIERLFEFSPDAILIADGNGVMRAANPRVEELFGYSSQELIGQPVEMLVPARFRGNHPRHREDYNAAPRTRQMGAALNLFGLRKDGTEFPVDIMLKPIETAAGPAVVSFIRDATEQRAAQEALRLNDLRLRSIVESIGDVRHLSARPRRPHPDVEPRRRAHQGVQGGRGAGLALLPVFYAGGPRPRTGPPSCCARPRPRSAWKKRAGACARMAPASGPMSCSRPSATAPAK